MKQHICLVGSLILIACFVYPVGAVTLETVLQTSLERNPDIQEAKSGLEQAAGKRWSFVLSRGLTLNWVFQPAFRWVTAPVRAE